MAVTVDLIKALREETRAGVMDCKRALEQADGDLEGARAILREQGLATAAKKASRAANDGLVESYTHSGGQVGAIVELNCETDFVARTPDFKRLAHDLAMQVAAMAPTYVSIDDIPEATSGVNFEEDCLMQQPYIKDPVMTVHDLVNEAVGKLGENIRVRRFARFSIRE